MHSCLCDNWCLIDESLLPPTMRALNNTTLILMLPLAIGLGWARCRFMAPFYLLYFAQTEHVFLFLHGSMFMNMYCTLAVTRRLLTVKTLKAKIFCHERVKHYYRNLLILLVLVYWFIWSFYMYPIIRSDWYNSWSHDVFILSLLGKIMKKVHQNSW